MATFDDIMRDPSLINQRDAGNCGFAAVLMHLARTNDPFLAKLRSYVEEEAEFDHNIRHTIDQKIKSSIHRRQYFQFTQPLDEVSLLNWRVHYDWYLIVALTLYFKRYADSSAFQRCVAFTRALQPSWKVPASSLKEAMQAIEQGQPFSEVRLKFDNSFKSGTLGLDEPGMQILLKLLNIRVKRPTFFLEWDGISVENLNSVFKTVSLASSSASHHTAVRNSIMAIWDKFKRALMGIAVGNSAFLGVEMIPAVGTRIPSALFFNHWVYILRIRESECEMWTYGASSKIDLTRSESVLTRSGKLFLPKILIEIDERVSSSAGGAAGAAAGGAAAGVAAGGAAAGVAAGGAATAVATISPHDAAIPPSVRDEDDGDSGDTDSPMHVIAAEWAPPRHSPTPGRGGAVIRHYSCNQCHNLLTADADNIHYYCNDPGCMNFQKRLKLS